MTLAIRCALTLALLTMTAACGAPARPAQSASNAAPEGTWRALPPSPLAPRYAAAALWVGDRLVLTGGTTAPPCPDNASCAPSGIPPLRDGAVFDPATRQWTRIADAPVPLQFPSAVALGRTVYVLAYAFPKETPAVRTAFVAYHLDADRWEELPLPPAPHDGLRLVARASDVVAYHGSQEHGPRLDQAYHPSARSWKPLPRDPLAPSYDRALVWTDRGLVLLGLEVVPNPGSERPSLYRAAALSSDDRTWMRLPDSEISGYGPDWFWAGARVVNPWVGSADGGTVNNWGRSYPFGGLLDPGASRWRSLPKAPRPGSYRGPTVGGPAFVATRGLVLHVASEEWVRLEQPPSRPHDGAAAVWAGDRLIVWGGYRWEAPTTPHLIDEGWMWEPIRK